MLYGLGMTAAPATGEAMNMSIDWEGWFVECLHHDDGGGLMTDAVERFEVFEGIGDSAGVSVDDGGG